MKEREKLHLLRREIDEQLKIDSMNIQGIYNIIKYHMNKYGYPKDTFLLDVQNGGTLAFTPINERNLSLEYINSKGQKFKYVTGFENKEKRLKQIQLLYGPLSDVKGIGKKFPDSFKKDLISLRDGDIITFNTGNHYVVNRKDNTLILTETFKGNFDNYKLNGIRLLDLKRSKSLVVDLKDDKNIQNLFLSMSDHNTENTTLRITNIRSAKAEINKITKKIKPNEAVQLNIGHIYFSAINTGNEIKWLDSKGKTIPEQKINFLFGYAQTAPVISEVIKTDNKKVPEIDKSDLSQIELMAKRNSFDEICNFIKNKCIKEGAEITISTLAKNDKGTYDPIMFVFKQEEEKEDYNIFLINQNTNEVLLVNEKYFIDIYKEKFKENVSLYRAEIVRDLDRDKLEEAMKENHITKEELINSIHKKIANHLKDSPLIKENDIKAVTDSIDILIEAYTKTSDAASKSNIKDEVTFEGMEIF